MCLLLVKKHYTIASLRVRQKISNYEIINIRYMNISLKIDLDKNLFNLIRLHFWIRELVAITYFSP